MKLGQSRELSVGDDITVISSGLMTEQALKAAQLLRGRGIGVNLVHVSTLKPFGDELLMSAIEGARRSVITMENHTIVGGLGSAVAEYVADNGLGKKVVRLGLQDTYAHGASTKYLMREYGLDAAALLQAVEAELRVDLRVTPEELDAISLETRDTKGNAESL